MLQEKVLVKIFILGVMLLTPTLGAGQEVVCQPLSDDEAAKFVTDPGQTLVRGSAVQCKTGATTIQVRFRIIDHTARYDCEIRATGEKAYCWRLS